MDRTNLERANRALLEAIETPPDTGVEPRLDRIAARLRATMERDERTPQIGSLCRLDRKLATLETRVGPRRAVYVGFARRRIHAHLGSVERGF